MHPGYTESTYKSKVMLKNVPWSIKCLRMFLSWESQKTNSSWFKSKREFIGWRKQKGKEEVLLPTLWRWGDKFPHGPSKISEIKTNDNARGKRGKYYALTGQEEAMLWLARGMLCSDWPGGMLCSDWQDAISDWSHASLQLKVCQLPLNQTWQLWRGHVCQCWEPATWQNFQEMSFNRVQTGRGWRRQRKLAHNPCSINRLNLGGPLGEPIFWEVLD